MLISKNSFLFRFLEHPVLFHWQNIGSYLSEDIHSVCWGFLQFTVSTLFPLIRLPHCCSSLYASFMLGVSWLCSTIPDCPFLFKSESIRYLCGDRTLLYLDCCGGYMKQPVIKWHRPGCTYCVPMSVSWFWYYWGKLGELHYFCKFLWICNYFKIKSYPNKLRKKK